MSYVKKAKKQKRKECGFYTIDIQTQMRLTLARLPNGLATLKMFQDKIIQLIYLSVKREKTRCE